VLPQGLQNGKIPNSAFTASSYERNHEPFKARIDNEDKWCPFEKGNEETGVLLGVVILNNYKQLHSSFFSSPFIKG